MRKMAPFHDKSTSNLWMVRTMRNGASGIWTDLSCHDFPGAARIMKKWYFGPRVHRKDKRDQRWRKDTYLRNYRLSRILYFGRFILRAFLPRAFFWLFWGAGFCKKAHFSGFVLVWSFLFCGFIRGGFHNRKEKKKKRRKMENERKREKDERRKKNEARR